jgi:hypothetical protein
MMRERSEDRMLHRRTPGGEFMRNVEKRAGKPKRLPSSKKKFEQACEQGRRRLALLQGGDRTAFDNATAIDLVGVYILFHVHVYKVSPEELQQGAAMMAACSAAGRMLRDAFAGDSLQAVAFIRWTWQREARAEKRRAGDSAAGFRIGWRLQFAHAGLLTDYRVAMARVQQAR